ncbi:hypothetical protein GCM10028818_40800 [Spirosoma horti]
MKHVVTYSSNLPKSIDEVKKCVVKITSASGTGSGFFVSEEGYVITNFHVVEGSYTGPNSVVQVDLASANLVNENVSIMGNFTQIEGVVIDVDTYHDLALIKLRVNPFKGGVQPIVSYNGVDSKIYYGKPKLSRKPLVDGQAIAVSGYPLNQPVLITNSGVVASIFGQNAYKTPPGDFPDHAYFADVQINHGNSGGPAYLAQTGEIIGVAVAFLFAQQEVANLQASNQATLDKLNNLYKATANPETKELIEIISNLQSATLYNSGLGVIIPLKFVIALLKKNSIKV